VIPRTRLGTRLSLASALAALSLLCAAGAAAQNSPAVAHQSPPVHYFISLAGRSQHLVHVSIDLPAGPAVRDLQLPVWNSLYQIRDFSQYVNWVRARSTAGQTLAVHPVDKSRWQISGAESGATIDYEIAADQPSPYGAQLNIQHAFFNLAEILMYPVDGRSSPMQVRFSDVPSDWRIATALAGSASEFTADNYDRLVDTPVEIGSFQEIDFDQSGGHYRVVVDADPADYDMQKIVPVVQRIVATATAWMKDRPFKTFVFLYHFPHGFNGGGMEHADSTAIDLNARMLTENPQALAEVTAHEFFHLWNVKRIRPQSLEPIDYTKENYSTALWFSEGVTNTVENYIRLSAGLIDEPRYLRHLAGQIEELERRPAHLTQSAEESSLDAWLEKYPSYALPQRSISYYNKGELLGVILDLAVRDASHGSASLREVFQWMNQNYPGQGRFLPDSEGVRQAAEKVSHGDLQAFFQKYVAGTDEIPWDQFFRSVGLHLARYSVSFADAGFQATRKSDGPPVVISVSPNGEADRAGLELGDSILEINRRIAGADFQQKLAELPVGDTLRLRVRNPKGEHELQWKLGSREEVQFELVDLDNVTPQQKARRAAWLKGEAQGDARP
jgi:predicted metalloprotease with PDZ domain